MDSELLEILGNPVFLDFGIPQTLEIFLEIPGTRRILIPRDSRDSVF